MMQGVDRMKSDCTRWVRAIAVSVLGFCFAACTKESISVPKAEYPTRIVGGWQGTVGGVKEAMSIYSDGTFVCQTHPMGFIGKKLSPGVAGTIRGTWKIDGDIITLRITGTENEPPTSRITSITIVAFTEAEIELRADLAESAQFFRVRMH
jgi:hypothetical protein